LYGALPVAPVNPAKFIYGSQWRIRSRRFKSRRRKKTAPGRTTSGPVRDKASHHAPFEGGGIKIARNAKFQQTF
jgi:hypothetical protein